MKKIYQFVIIFLIFQFVILFGYFGFINFGNRFDLSFLFDEEFVIMLAIALVFFLSVNIISNFLSVILKDRIEMLEKSFLSSFDLVLDSLNNSLIFLNKLSLNLNNNLFILIKLDQKVFLFFDFVEIQQNLLQNFYFQFLFLYNLLFSKKLF